ncbi:hypothetical protein JXA56_02205 [Candidatus Micrarchaeota archaeon]|nr:hypothetical protein [Candidatus Micrarchaeota archaeon]
MDFLLPILIAMPPAALSFIGVSLMLSVFIVAFAYMISYFMQNPQLTALAKEELAALFFSVFIIMFWFTFDTFLNSITLNLVAASLPSEWQGFAAGGGQIGGLASNHIDLAIASIEIMISKLKDVYIDLYLYEALIGFLSTISFPLGSPVPGLNVISFSLAPFVGLTLLSNAHTVVVESVGYLITLIWAKEFFLLFARDAVPLFLLPFGIALRAFPFLRRTGSSIIALSFAFYFVFPFALILSNYLIFDIYKPADFTYNPSSASFFGSEATIDGAEDTVEQSKDPTSHLLGEFEAPSIVETAQGESDSECYGNYLTRFFCSAKHLANTAVDAVTGFISTIWNIWKFMMGMTGDFFFTGFNNPLMPPSTSAGLYYFIIRELTILSPFIILVMFTTVLEIIITVTMYRNVSLLIGGEAEIIGLTKIV